MRYDKNDPELEIIRRFSGGFEGKRMLEVGCGNGRITRKLAPLVDYLDAIDPDEEKIAKAISWADGGAVHYHATDLEKFQPANPYDLILLSWSL
ncbi:MAG: class I SAM-dependent methyltransferase [Chloroflexota bacterium]